MATSLQLPAQEMKLSKKRTISRNSLKLGHKDVNVYMDF